MEEVGGGGKEEGGIGVQFKLQFWLFLSCFSGFVNCTIFPIIISLFSVFSKKDDAFFHLVRHLILDM